MKAYMSIPNGARIYFDPTRVQVTPALAWEAEHEARRILAETEDSGPFPPAYLSTDALRSFHQFVETKWAMAESLARFIALPIE